MIDFEHFLFEVFGSNNPNNNKIYARLLVESRYKIKHPITCETPSAYYKRTNKVELINGDAEKEITLIGSQEFGPSYFVSSNKNPRDGEVNRIWTDNNNIYSVSWGGPNIDYLLYTVSTVDSSQNISTLEIYLFDRKTLRNNKPSNAEDIAEILSKIEIVHPLDSTLVPDVSILISACDFPNNLIPYSLLLDQKSLSSRVLPKRKHMFSGNLTNTLKRLVN